MKVTYESLADGSRIFIYPASRKFYSEELPVIQLRLQEFCEAFDGVDLTCKIDYDRFLVFIISEQTPLDLDQQNVLVGFVQDLEKEFDLVLLDKVNVFFKQGQYVQLKEIPEFKKLIRNRGVSKKTIVFDLMVNNKYEYEHYSEVPAGESWVSHFF